MDIGRINFSNWSGPLGSWLTELFHRKKPEPVPEVVFKKEPAPERFVKKEPGLCDRCEYHVRARLVGHGPRYECAAGLSYGCYMYKPVLPALLGRLPGDKRSIGGMAIIRARSRYLGVVTDDMVQGSILGTNNKYFIYYMPRQKPKIKRRRHRS
jgi:hypothetical protein